MTRIRIVINGSLEGQGSRLVYSAAGAGANGVVGGELTGLVSVQASIQLTSNQEMLKYGAMEIRIERKKTGSGVDALLTSWIHGEYGQGGCWLTPCRIYRLPDARGTTISDEWHIGKAQIVAHTEYDEDSGPYETAVLLASEWQNINTGGGRPDCPPRPVIVPEFARIDYK